MGNDTPDWGGQYVTQSIYPLSDMGELAARLGSPIKYDRRGSLVHIEDFEYGLRDNSSFVNGTGAELALSAAHGVTGAFCARLNSGSSSGATCQLIYQVPQPASALVGCAAFVGFPDVKCNVYLKMDTFTGSLNYVRIVKMAVDVTTTISILTDSGYVVLDSNYILQTGTKQFGFFKLVVNQTTGQAQRLIVDGTEYDLTGYVFPSGSASTYKYLGLTVENERNGGANANIYCDALIFTANEPPNA